MSLSGFVLLTLLTRYAKSVCLLFRRVSHWQQLSWQVCECDKYLIPYEITNAELTQQTAVSWSENLLGVLLGTMFA